MWSSIRVVRPPVLLVVADGPRTEAERNDCEATRRLVECIDWPCDVRRNYSAVNMGCRQRMATGLTWVFEQVEEAVILEDDCLPHPTFFRYCEELLERYRNDRRVMHIGGNTFQGRKPQKKASYYFSKYAHVWGWASWRRAWQHYDVNMAAWGGNNNPVIERYCNGPIEKHYWTVMFKGAAEGRLDTWDYAWLFACWQHDGLSIVPEVNLITNIGFGVGSTHTTDDQSPFANMVSQSIQFPLRHPKHVEIHSAADGRTFRTLFVPREPMWLRVNRWLARLFASVMGRNDGVATKV